MGLDQDVKRCLSLYNNIAVPNSWLSFFLKIITDSRIRSFISKEPKYRFPAHIDFNKCRETIAIALNDYLNYPKLSFQYLKQGIQEFHRKYVLAPADKAANNVVVV